MAEGDSSPGGISGADWMGFTGDTPIPTARKVYRERIGRDADKVIEHMGNVLAGPLPRKAAPEQARQMRMEGV